MVIYLAGLQGIPTELYESASIDGAGAINRFFRITLPMLSPVIFFNMVLGTITVFQQFNAAFIITQGGPARATYLYALMLYETAFVNYRMGYASGLAWVLLTTIAAITAINFALSKFWVFYGDERG
jgi:multiple sugar transport system permease protein